MVSPADMGAEFLEAYRAFKRATYHEKKDMYLQYSKNHYNKNKEKYQAYGREYYHNKIRDTPLVVCVCGKPIKPTSMSHHKMSKFHIKFITEQEELEQSVTSEEKESKNE